MGLGRVMVELLKILQRLVDAINHEDASISFMVLKNMEPGTIRVIAQKLPYVMTGVVRITERTDPELLIINLREWVSQLNDNYDPPTSPTFDYLNAYFETRRN